MIQVSIARLAECKWNTLVVIEEAVPASLLVFAAVGREEAGSVKVLAGFDLASVAAGRSRAKIKRDREQQSNKSTLIFSFFCTLLSWTTCS